MSAVTKAPPATPRKKGRWANIASNFKRDLWLYLMLIPGLVYFLIYKYGPMWGLLISFKDYQPFLGFFDSPWVGMKHFIRFFSNDSFMQLFNNTLIISVLNIAFNFPLPIVLALLLNEVRNKYFKRTIQTITYLPHFISWVVVSGITYVMFTTEGGIVNEALKFIGMEPVNFLASESMFRPMIIGQSIWKETGWGTIIYLAALSGVDVAQYEAARIDGANRLQQLWYVTLPSIKSTIILLFILRLGSVMDTSFDQLFSMLNEMNRSVGEVFDTYVYKVGINSGQFSYATAVGLFKSLVGLILVLAANWISRKAGEEGVI